MKNRFIFDLDGTLLQWDGSIQEKYFKSIYPEDDALKLLNNIPSCVDQYELFYEKYDVKTLSTYLTSATGVEVTDKVILGWIDAYHESVPVLIDGILDVLKYLKSKGKSLVVLTNWFLRTQAFRLEKAGILKYFDAIYSGEIATKPHKESYLAAKGDFDIQECVMIGDNYLRDYIGALDVSMDAVLFDPNKKNTNIKNSIHDMRELKEMF